MIDFGHLSAAVEMSVGSREIKHIQHGILDGSHDCNGSRVRYLSYHHIRGVLDRLYEMLPSTGEGPRAMAGLSHSSREHSSNCLSYARVEDPCSL